MSCGEEHPECAEVVSNVFRFLDGEETLSASVTYTRIEQHLVDCSGCEDDYANAVERLDQALAVAIERSCHDVHASADLLERVKTQLEQLRQQQPRPGL